MQNCKECKAEVHCDKGRVLFHHEEKEYSYVNYLTYCLYVPLYLAGPIMTFGDYTYQVYILHVVNMMYSLFDNHWQMKHRIIPFNARSFTMYFARLLFCLLTLEIILHNMYIVAISKVSHWDAYLPFEVLAVGYWNLKVIWLKLLVIWRFFRFAALCDDINPPENMTRCMSNNYSPVGFWRSWHRSYNLWLIRYVYIPLGGRHTQKWNTFVIFTFVALWHDISASLLAWGWIISLFIIPELLLTRMWSKVMNSTSIFQKATTNDDLSVSKEMVLPGRCSFWCSVQYAHYGVWESDWFLCRLGRL